MSTGKSPGVPGLPGADLTSEAGLPPEPIPLLQSPGIS